VERYFRKTAVISGVNQLAIIKKKNNYETKNICGSLFTPDAGEYAADAIVCIESPGGAIDFGGSPG
jgi:hypothetical protein